MKNVFFYLLLVVSFASCKNEYEEDEAHLPLTYEQELSVINNFTTIDSVNMRYSVIITDEIMQQYNLTEKNVLRALKEIESINYNIERDIKDGKVVTLTLNNANGFKAYTANTEKTQIKFSDVYVPESDSKDSRGGYVGGMSFANGNWYKYTATFNANDHVTSDFSVGSCNGYWSVSVTCKTGTSSYGTVFTAYGSSHTSGSIKRYWWYTSGGTAPYSWTFTANGPVGGNAMGSFSVSNTY
ncbi:hypothetical protein [Phocaeicola vulgatus]|jgi:hypothetical protein|uniref:hypothetical protein n=1 Tax=Phocaeicola vulgatus TaxID=821 RepID=UPI002165E657|nr:hypothetical protein [Phocaeicola vulgatus]MCS2749149.1 hypothetical protein [Phocaeicola vulgatus]